MSTLTHEQYTRLVQPLAEHRVAKVQGMSHLEAWDVRRHLIRIFGFGGWDFTVVSCELVREVVDENRRKRNREGQEYGEPYTAWTVVYRVIGRLALRVPDGSLLATYEDGATGDAVNQPSLGDAHDLALKSALSQALKRCAVNLGDQFGLSLYKDGALGVVGRSLVAPPEPEGGEDDDGTTHPD